MPHEQQSHVLIPLPLSGGQNLNQSWRRVWRFTLPLPAEGNWPPGQKVWQFAPYLEKEGVFVMMAPLDRAGAYQQRDGLARFSAQAVRLQAKTSQSP